VFPLGAVTRSLREDGAIKMNGWGCIQAKIANQIKTTAYNLPLRIVWFGSTALCGVIVFPVATIAQQAPAPTARQITAIDFSIPAQPLPAAVGAFIRATGWQVGYSTRIADGMMSRSVSGSMAPAQALRLLLAGTGITARFTGPTTATLIGSGVPASGGVYVPGSLQLEAINVDGAATSVNGYVAMRSASGTKTDVPLLEVPQTVNVITRQEMDDRGVQDFHSALSYTPGIRAVDYPGGQGSPDIYLRGFRAFNLFALYRDGSRSGFNQYDTDLEQYAFERIDVLKGPSSILYGQASPGGLIDATTKRPTEVPFHELQFQYGSFARKQVTVDFSGPINPERTLMYRFTGLWRDSGTQIHYSPDDRIYLAPSLKWKPDEATSFTILANYQKSKKGGSEQSLPMDNTIFGNGVRLPSSLFLGAPGLSTYDIENTSIGYEFIHKFDTGWTVKQNARYMYSDVNYVWGFISDWPIRIANGRFANIMVQKRPKTTNTFLLDTNLNGHVDTGPIEHRLLAGVDYAYYDSKETRTNSTNIMTFDVLNPIYNSSSLNFGLPWSDTKDKLSQVGIYGQDQMKWNNWLLSLNGRYDWVDTQQLYYYTRTVYAPFGVSDELTKQNSSAFTGRIGLGYLFENGVAPYASYATSFQPATGTDVRGVLFRPTTGEQWEAGVKYQPIGVNATLSAAVYQITQRNVTTADPINMGFSVQQGEVRSRGAEFEAKVNLIDNWSGTMSYAYTDARITRDNPNAVGVSAIGKRNPSVPFHQFSLWLDYLFPQEELRGLKMGAGLRYVGPSAAPMDVATGRQIEVPGYALMDASITYDFGLRNPTLQGVSLIVSGTNLTDERYFTPGFYSNSVFDGYRRRVNATVSYRW